MNEVQKRSKEIATLLRKQEPGTYLIQSTHVYVKSTYADWDYWYDVVCHERTDVGDVVDNLIIDESNVLGHHWALY